MEEMKLLLGKTDKEFDRIKCDAKKVFEALEKVIPKNFLKKKVRYSKIYRFGRGVNCAIC